MYLQQLTHFFTLVSSDKRISTVHISCYMALFQCWNSNHFQNPVSISRGKIMRMAKIRALTTYHKCMKGLHESGYITYLPSYHPVNGSVVYINSLFQPAKPCDTSS